MQTPRAVIGELPSSVTSPPQTADDQVVSVTGDVVTLGNISFMQEDTKNISTIGVIKNKYSISFD
jgi:hypothetical protein